MHVAIHSFGDFKGGLRGTGPVEKYFVKNLEPVQALPSVRPSVPNW